MKSQVAEEMDANSEKSGLAFRTVLTSLDLVLEKASSWSWSKAMVGASKGYMNKLLKVAVDEWSYDW